MEEINILNDDSSFELEKKMLIKIFSIKTIKKLNIDKLSIDDNEISKIIGQNTSVKKLCFNEIPNNTFYNIQNKFPNSSKLQIVQCNFFKKIESIKLDIKEKSNLKMTKIKFYGKLINDLKFYIQSYENLESIYINMNEDILNLKNAIPLFNEKCKIEFKSLKKFIFYNEKTEMNIENLKNLFFNIEKLPKLIKFGLCCFSKEIKEDLYMQFVKKLLSMNLEFLVLRIKTTVGNDTIIQENYDIDDVEYYSRNELKELCPNLKYYRFKLIRIAKFNKLENN